MENDLYNNIIKLPNRVKKDKDVLGLFVGSPGEGKSTMAQQCLYLLDPTITVDSIKYTYEDYITYSLELRDRGKSKGRGVMHDEARESLSGLSIMHRRTRKFLNFLYENRQLNMYQFILAGDFFDIPKSIIMQRCLFMIWVHEAGAFDNGFFKFYNRPDLKRLYIMGKKLRNMRASKHTLNGRFPKFYTVNEKEYRKFKAEHLKISRYVAGPENKDKITKTELIWKILDHNVSAGAVSISRVLNCSPNLVWKVKKDFKTHNTG